MERLRTSIRSAGEEQPAAGGRQEARGDIAPRSGAAPTARHPPPVAPSRSRACWYRAPTASSARADAETSHRRRSAPAGDRRGVGECEVVHGSMSTCKGRRRRIVVADLPVGSTASQSPGRPDPQHRDLRARRRASARPSARWASYSSGARAFRASGTSIRPELTLERFIQSQFWGDSRAPDSTGQEISSATGRTDWTWRYRPDNHQVNDPGIGSSSSRDRGGALKASGVRESVAVFSERGREDVDGGQEDRRVRRATKGAAMRRAGGWWREIWDAAYADEARGQCAPQIPSSTVAGWKSDTPGEPIPERSMASGWTHTTASIPSAPAPAPESSRSAGGKGCSSSRGRRRGALPRVPISRPRLRLIEAESMQGASRHVYFATARRRLRRHHEHGSSIRHGVTKSVLQVTSRTSEYLVRVLEEAVRGARPGA